MDNDYVASDILGTGFRFPFSVDGRGGVAMASQETDIDEAIRIILGTARGERRMRPLFGSRINELVFAPNNASTWGLMKQYINEALAWWEPRIEVLDIDVGSDVSDASRLLVNIHYRVKTTSDERSLVYPFYIAS
jgi:phage baseplate assembly protein W